jgi:hypothetical protein
LFKSCVESRFFGKRLKSYYSSPDDQCAAGAEYAPEQMIWISILERLIPQYTWEPVHNRVLLLNPLSVINHEKAMFANLLIANFDSLGLSFKKAFSAPEHPRSCYTPEEYKTLNAESRSSPSKYNLQLAILGSTTHYWFLCKTFCSRIKRFLCF